MADTNGLAGLVIGNYVLLEKIGEGGFGVVYAAKNRYTEEKTAYKILKQNALDGTKIKLFDHEQKLMISLNHQNIIQCLDVGVVSNTNSDIDGYPYINMEYAASGSLESIIRKNEQFKNKPDVVQLGEYETLDELRTLEITKQVLMGLEYLHSKKKFNGTLIPGIVHGDLHAGNLLLCNDGQIKIADIGLSRAIRDTTSSAYTTTLTRGAPKLKAPEVNRPNYQPDVRSDLFRIGCIMQQMLIGYDNTLFEEEHDAIKQTDSRLVAIIRKAMQPRMNDRHQTAAEMLGEVEKAYAQIREYRYKTRYTTPVNEILNGNKGRLVGFDDIYRLYETLDSAEAFLGSESDTVRQIKTQIENRRKSDEGQIINYLKHLKGTSYDPKKDVVIREQYALLAHAWDRHPYDDFSCLIALGLR